MIDLGKSGPLPREARGTDVTVRATIGYCGLARTTLYVGGAIANVLNDRLRAALVEKPDGPYLAVLTDDPDDSNVDRWAVDGPDGSICMIDTPAQDAQRTAHMIADALNAEPASPLAGRAIALLRKMATPSGNWPRNSDAEFTRNTLGEFVDEARAIIEELDA